jgi:hypothetical protein
MTSSVFSDAVARIAEGREAESVVEAASIAAALVDQARDTLQAATPELTLLPLEEEFDKLAATAVALIAVGNQDLGLRGVAIALRILGDGSTDRHGLRNPVAEALLARATLFFVAAALAWERTEALPMLTNVVRVGRQGPPTSVLVDASLRHPDLWRSGADRAYAAHLEWLLSRPWRGSVPTLISDDAVHIAFAEADIIGACLTNVLGRVGAYSPGVARHGRAAQDRLVARLEAKRQRASIAECFAVAEAELETTLETSYNAIRLGEWTQLPSLRNSRGS